MALYDLTYVTKTFFMHQSYSVKTFESIYTLQVCPTRKTIFKKKIRPHLRLSHLLLLLLQPLRQLLHLLLHRLLLLLHLIHFPVFPIKLTLRSKHLKRKTN